MGMPASHGNHHMRLTGIAPQFVVPDVVQAAEYYRDKLGFTILGYFRDPPVFAMVSRDGIEIHFGKSDTGEAAPGTQQRRGGLDAYINVEDLDGVYRDLQKRGANIIDGPTVRIYKMREIVIKDLNGYVIAFGEDAS
jgi:catechol 2,3-dioxygenase-like lactoylglutathione lyase family enzyme